MKLPNEIWLEIFKHLSNREIIKLRRVSYRFKKLAAKAIVFEHSVICMRFAFIENIRIEPIHVNIRFGYLCSGEYCRKNMLNMSFAAKVISRYFKMNDEIIIERILRDSFSFKFYIYRTKDTESLKLQVRRTINILKAIEAAADQTQFCEFYHELLDIVAHVKYDVAFNDYVCILAQYFNNNKILDNFANFNIPNSSFNLKYIYNQMIYKGYKFAEKFGQIAAAKGKN